MAQVLDRSARFPTPGLPDNLWPLFWLVVGLLSSYVYIDAALLSTALFGHRDPVPTLVIPLFPPQAVVLSVLLLTPPRNWWLYLLAYCAIYVTRTELLGVPRSTIVLTTVADVVEPLVGALLFLRLVPRFTQFTLLREVGTYVGCAILGAMLGASVGAAARALRDFPFWTSWQSWFLADVLASLVLAPTIILWAGAGFRGVRARSPARAVEATILYGGLLGAGWLVFASGMHDPDAPGVWLYLPLPLLLWTAVRFGPRGLMSGLSVLVVLGIAGIANDRSPSVGGSTVGNVLTLQIFLLGVGIPLFLLAALVCERETSERRYRAAVSNYPQGMVMLFEADTRHLFGDGQGLPELGLSPDSVAGKSLREAFPAEVAAALAPRYQAALNGEATTRELVHGGRTYQAHVLPVATGAATGMIVMQDITEQRRAQALALSEAALRATNGQLEAVSRAKSEFLSVAAHELKTPITSLRVFATLLIRQLDEGGTIDPERLRRALEMIDQQSDRLSRLINQLLDVSRIEAGRLGLSREIQDLMPIVQMTVEAARATTARHSIRVDGPSETRAYVDSLRLEQVLTNLLDNAVKYSPDGGEVDVTVDAPAPDAVRLVVRDHGVGISTEARNRIFERFYREDESDPTSGMGLGLFISRQIVELHGGQIEAEPAEGGGTRFIVTLPRNAAGP